MTTRPAPKPDPWDFETLLTIDKRIDTREDENIRDRWEFGRVMLAARADKKRLPSGYLAALIERTGKSQSELSYRLRCAEVYPTEAELSNALELFPSWHELVQNLYEPVPSWTKEEIARFVELEKRIDEADRRAAERAREITRDKWKIGQLLLTERDEDKQLPKGRLAEVAKLTGRSEQELSYWMQFGEKFPTEDELLELLSGVGSFLTDEPPFAKAYRPIAKAHGMTIDEVEELLTELVLTRRDK
jgi:hypothetical protein